MILKPRMHVLRAQQFRDPTMLYQLFAIADRLVHLASQTDSRTSLGRLLEGGTMYQVFYEPSTRTRFSFGAAARLLGMDVDFTENAGTFSSAAKGETLEHTIRVLAGQQVNVIVLRHEDDMGSQRAAEVIDKYFKGKVAIINAGDGREQHPTQALIDVFTIWKLLGRLDDLKVVIGGDLKNGRTCRSLSYLLSQFSNIEIDFVSPPELAMRQDILSHLTEHNVTCRVTEDLPSALQNADVVYWTRVQRERLQHPEEFPRLRDAYHIGMPQMAMLKDKAILMHPMPIVGEISPEVDDHAKAVYFTQANNGQFIRAALLLHIFGVSP